MTDNLVADGMVDFSGGQDASKAPSRIAENAFHAGINVNVKQGVPTPRDPFLKKDITYAVGGIRISTSTIRTYKDIFLTGRYQLSAPYSIGVDNYIVTVVSGIIFLININTLRQEVINIEDGSFLNENAFRLNYSSAGKYFVIYDYPAYPVIIDGFQAYRADPLKNEIPVSVLGAFNDNRLIIVNAGQEFTAGDPVGNPVTPDAPITFNEILVPSSPYNSQVFGLSSSNPNDRITAITFLQASDTSTGIGQTLIATRNGIWSYNTQNPRSTWEQGQFGANFLFDTGIAGPRAFVHVGSDVYFMSYDGQVRTLSMSRDEQKRWAKVPLSREVQNWLKFWDKDLVQFASLAYFNNKIYITCNPYRVTSRDRAANPITDYTHGGLAVLGLEGISSLGVSGRPAWDGLWTGVRPLDLVTTNNRCFVIAKDENFINTIYEIDPDETRDYADGKYRDIKSVIYTKAFDCKDPFQNKDTHSIDIALGKVAGNFELKAEFKPDHAENYGLWQEFKHLAPVEDCLAEPTCFNGHAEHSFSHITFGSPIDADKVDPVSETLYSRFRRLQLRLTLKGMDWELREFKLKAVPVPQLENEDSLFTTFKEVAVCEDCSADWAVEGFNQC